MRVISASSLATKADGSLEIKILPGPELASSWSCFALGVTAIVSVFATQSVVLFFVGLLFCGCGVLLLLNVTSRTISISRISGATTIVTSRLFGGGELKQIFPQQYVERIDYAEGYSNSTQFGRANRYSSVYLTTKNGENIVLLEFRGVKYIAPLYLPSFTQAAPLNEQAAFLAAYLNVPLNTIQLQKISDIKNIFTPNDRTRLVRGRPTQAQLDIENQSRFS